MRVVHITPFFQLDIQRWTEKLVLNQAKYCSYNLEVITTNLDTTGKPIYSLGEERIEDVTVRRIRGIKIRNQFLPLSKEIFRKIECDILHIHNFGIIFNELFFLKNRNIPTVLKPDIGRLYPSYNSLKSVEWMYVDVVTAFNDREVEILRRLGFNNKNIKLIPWGVDESFREIGKKITPKEEEILIVARIIPIKNIELAIKAIANIEKTILNVAGPIVDIHYFKYLKKLCEKLGVSKRVRFKGAIPYEKIAYEFASNYLTLATSSHESGGPASVIESLATGRPAICVPLELVKSLRKYYAKDDYGGVIVVDKYDPIKIAEKIEFLQQNKIHWKKLSISGLKAAEKFSWKIVIKELDKIYKSISS